MDIGGTDALLNCVSQVSEDILPVQLNLVDPKVKTIAGVIADTRKSIPLADESGDIIISTRTFPLYAENADQVSAFFREIKRVVAKGGEVYITPFPTPKYFCDFFLQSATYKDFGLLNGQKKSLENVQNVVLPNLKRINAELNDMFDVDYPYTTPNGLQSIILKSK